MEVGVGPGHIVLDGDPAPLSQKGDRAQFSAHFYCRQMAGWIEMSLGMEVGLGPSHIVLDGDPALLPQKGDRPPIFGPFLLSPNGWVHQDATWYGGRPQPRRLCVRWGPSFSSPKAAQPPNFCPMSVVVKRLDGWRRHLVRK